MAQQHNFYAIVLPGLEKLAAAELETFSAHDIEINHGGVRFSGTMPLLHRVNLRSRVITRVLVRLRTFRSMTLDGLRYDLEKVAWHLFFDEHTELDVQVITKQSRLNHSDDIADYTKEMIQRFLPKLGTSTDSKKHLQTLHIRIENNRGTLSLDTSGERLDRRGYRLESGKAPLRETLASAILQWAEWNPQTTLLNPMCGSGTFAIEAALAARHQAPNLNHDFSCLHWPSLKVKDFNNAMKKCQDMQKDTKTSILASDLHGGAVEICQNNAKRADVNDMIEISKLDIHHLTCPDDEQGGIIVINPPYGNRIGEHKVVLSLWHDIGKVIQEQFMAKDNWKSIIVCPDVECEKALNLKPQRRLHVSHGGTNAVILEI
ncbi:MAG: RNA methyltransferase [Ghiorsea sp.]